MKLPPALTTVTPLSKSLALFLLLFLTLSGFLLGMRYQQATNALYEVDPRLRIFETKQECESFTNRMCLATVCEAEPTHDSCTANNQKGWFATRQQKRSASEGNIQETTPATMCTTDADCWCRGFTGAEFTETFNQWTCNTATQRCEQCIYL